MKVTWISVLFLAAISASAEDHSWATKLKPGVHVLDERLRLSDYIYEDNDGQEYNNRTRFQDPLSTIMGHVIFECESKVEGYYADKMFNCKVFHYCNQHGKRFTFLCPPKSIFNQKYKICDYEFGITCGYTEKYFNLNDQQDLQQNATSHVDVSVPTTDRQKHSQTSKIIQNTSFQDRTKLEEQFGMVNSSLAVLITQPRSERNSSGNPSLTHNSQKERHNHPQKDRHNHPQNFGSRKYKTDYLFASRSKKRQKPLFVKEYTEDASIKKTENNGNERIFHNNRNHKKFIVEDKPSKMSNISKIQIAKHSPGDVHNFNVANYNGTENDDSGYPFINHHSLTQYNNQNYKKPGSSHYGNEKTISTFGKTRDYTYHYGTKQLQDSQLHFKSPYFPSSSTINKIPLNQPKPHIQYGLPAFHNSYEHRQNFVPSIYRLYNPIQVFNKPLLGIDKEVQNVIQKPFLSATNQQNTHFSHLGPFHHYLQPSHPTNSNHRFRAYLSGKPIINGKRKIYPNEISISTTNKKLSQPPTISTINHESYVFPSQGHYKPQQTKSQTALYDRRVNEVPKYPNLLLTKSSAYLRQQTVEPVLTSNTIIYPFQQNHQNLQFDIFKGLHHPIPSMNIFLSNANFNPTIQNFQKNIPLKRTKRENTDFVNSKAVFRAHKSEFDPSRDASKARKERHHRQSIAGHFSNRDNPVVFVRSLSSQETLLPNQESFYGERDRKVGEQTPPLLSASQSSNSFDPPVFRSSKDFVYEKDLSLRKAPQQFYPQSQDPRISQPLLSYRPQTSENKNGLFFNTNSESSRNPKHVDEDIENKHVVSSKRGYKVPFESVNIPYNGHRRIPTQQRHPQFLVFPSQDSTSLPQDVAPILGHGPKSFYGYEPSHFTLSLGKPTSSNVNVPQLPNRPHNNGQQDFSSLRHRTPPYGLVRPGNSQQLKNFQPNYPTWFTSKNGDRPRFVESSLFRDSVLIPPSIHVSQIGRHNYNHDTFESNKPKKRVVGIPIPINNKDIPGLEVSRRPLYRLRILPNVSLHHEQQRSEKTFGELVNPKESVLPGRITPQRFTLTNKHNLDKGSDDTEIHFESLSGHELPGSFISDPRRINPGYISNQRDFPRLHPSTEYWRKKPGHNFEINKESSPKPFAGIEFSGKLTQVRQQQQQQERDLFDPEVPRKVQVINEFQGRFTPNKGIVRPVTEANIQDSLHSSLEGRRYPGILVESAGRENPDNSFGVQKHLQTHSNLSVMEIEFPYPYQSTEPPVFPLHEETKNGKLTYETEFILVNEDEGSKQVRVQSPPKGQIFRTETLSDDKTQSVSNSRGHQAYPLQYEGKKLSLQTINNESGLHLHKFYSTHSESFQNRSHNNNIAKPHVQISETPLSSTTLQDQDKIIKYYNNDSSEFTGERFGRPKVPQSVAEQVIRGDVVNVSPEPSHRTFYQSKEETATEVTANKPQQPLPSKAGVPYVSKLAHGKPSVTEAEYNDSPLNSGEVNKESSLTKNVSPIPPTLPTPYQVTLSSTKLTASLPTTLSPVSDVIIKDEVTQSSSGTNNTDEPRRSRHPFFKLTSFTNQRQRPLFPGRVRKPLLNFKGRKTEPVSSSEEAELEERKKTEKTRNRTNLGQTLSSREPTNVDNVYKELTTTAEPEIENNPKGIIFRNTQINKRRRLSFLHGSKRPSFFGKTPTIVSASGTNSNSTISSSHGSSSLSKAKEINHVPLAKDGGSTLDIDATEHEDHTDSITTPLPTTKPKRIFSSKNGGSRSLFKKRPRLLSFGRPLLHDTGDSDQSEPSTTITSSQ
ncbi:uncharacterized protein LOC143245152 [Tachypleus tridentatus]|uniref:uncharacterized protein LOC143245152 n=1 Tax=Tachypleus tridentatus TaxID=6853 RepID=UPI003FD0CD65